MATAALAMLLSCAGLAFTPGDARPPQSDITPTLESAIEQLQNLIARGQPEGENAWPLLAEAAKILQAGDSRRAYFDLLFRLNWAPTYDFDQREHAHASRVYELVKAAGVPELIDQGVTCQRMVMPLDDWDGAFPPIASELRVVSTFQYTMMREAMDAGDADAIVRHFAGELKLAEFASHQPGLVSSLVSIATLSRVCEEIRARLISGSLPVEACRLMIGRIQQVAFAPSTKVLETELLIARAHFRQHFDQSGTIPDADKRTLVAALEKARSADFFDLPILSDQVGKDAEQIDLGEWRFPSWGEFDGWLSTAFADLSRRDQLPLAQWPAPIGIEVQQEPQRVALADMAQVMCRAAENYLHSRTRVLLELRGTKVMLALHLYHSDNGTFPATLDALIPDILPQMPIDPANGGPFGYHLLDDDEHGRPYLLYSLGVDGIDNVGQQPQDRTERHRALSRTDGAGFDFVINEARDPDWF